MINWIADKLGYINKSRGVRDLKKSPLTEEELSFMLADVLKTSDYEVDEQSEKKLFKELKKVSGLVDYLKETSNRDMRRYFGAVSKEEQLIIRGAYARTNYFKAKIISGGEGKKPRLDMVS